AAALAFLIWHSRPTRVLALTLMAASLVVFVAIGPHRAMNVAISQSGPGMTGNVSGRIELWSRAIDGITDFPLTGMGMNSCRKVMPVLYPAFQVAPDFDIAHAHNHLLQAALDLGIPGLLAYLAVWVILAAMLAEVVRRAASPAHRSMASGLAAGFIA